MEIARDPCPGRRMAVPEAEPPFCRLYIDTSRPRDAIGRLLDALLRSGPGELCIHASVSQKEGYAPDRARGEVYDPILASAWTAELDAEPTHPEGHDAFQARVVVAIIGARARGMIVTASCDFEERVAAETGWNWSASTTEPPR